MAVTDLHSLDVSTALNKIFSNGAKTRGTILSLVNETPKINFGANVPLVMSGRAKGALVHEGGSKPDNGRKVTSRPFTTVKLVYSQRVTEEFLAWADERQADFVSQLVSDWLGKSLGRDIDTVVIHGYDPASNKLDTELSDYIMKTGSSILVPFTGTADATKLDKAFGEATEALNGQNINGIAIAGDAAQMLSTVMNGSTQKYPGLGAFGIMGDNIAGVKAASTPEVGALNNVKLVIGDWDQLLLGFAGEAAWRTLTAGDPDGTGVDLGNVNQVCIRLELGFGFRVLDPEAFAVVAQATSNEG